MGRRSGRGIRRGERAYRGVVGLIAIGALGVLILFLLRRSRGDIGESVEQATETAKSKAEEYTGTSKREQKSQEAVEPSADQEKGVTEQTEDQEREATEDRHKGDSNEHREELRGIIRESVRRSEESLANQEAPARETREELRSIVKESVRRSEGSSSDREESNAGEPSGETKHTRTEETTGDQTMIVVGVLAKMGEGFQETGGGQFILSSEEEGNLDLHGKEEELEEVYKQQIEARVEGRITDEDSQPRKMEVDKVEPA